MGKTCPLCRFIYEFTADIYIEPDFDMHMNINNIYPWISTHCYMQN